MVSFYHCSESARPGFEPVTFGFPNLPEREASALLIRPSGSDFYVFLHFLPALLRLQRLTNCVLRLETASKALCVTVSSRGACKFTAVRAVVVAHSQVTAGEAQH